MSDVFSQGADFKIKALWKLDIKNANISVTVETLGKEQTFDYKMPECQDCIENAPNHIQVCMYTLGSKYLKIM